MPGATRITLWVLVLHVGCATPGERVFGAEARRERAVPVRPAINSADLEGSERAPDGSSVSGAARQTPLVASPPPDGALTLEQILNRALDANRGLLDARANVSAAGYDLASSREPFQLRIFPTTAATVSGGDTSSDLFGVGVELRQRFETGTRVTVGPEVERRDDDYTSRLNATVRQPLLRGRQREFVLSSVDAAEFSARSTRRSLYRAQVDTVLSTVVAAYQVVRQREFLRLNEDSAERLAGHAEAARARERAGLASSLDVYRATLQYNQALDSLDSAREAYGDALDSLRILLALDLSSSLEVDAPLTYDLVRLAESDAIATALAERIELDQAEDALADSERRGRVARYGTDPDLDIFVSWNQAGTSPEFDRSLDLDDSSVSVSLVTTSDLARTAEFARYGQALLEVTAAQRNLDFQTDQVIRQVRRDLRDLERAEKRIANQEEQIRQSGGKLELARIKFNRGLASNFDVIEAESELRSAQTGLVSAVIEYIVGTYRLRASLGTLLERPGAP